MDRIDTSGTNDSALSRRRFLVVGGLGAGALLAGCGGGKAPGETATGGGAKPGGAAFSGKYDGPNLELAYWNGFTGGDGPFMQKLVQQFNSEHPNIAVKANTIRWADFYAKLPTAVQASKGPEVGVMHLDQLATFAARKSIVPIDDVATSIGATEGDFAKPVWRAGVYKDARYGIPLDVHSLAMYYNTNLFQKAGLSEAPQTAADFDASLQKLKAGTPQPFWMPVLWPSHLMFLSLLWQAGGEPYSAAGDKATFDSEAGVKALSWQVDQINKGYSPKNVAIDSQYVAFKNGKVAVTWDGIWQINDLKAAKVPFGIAPVPQIFDTKAVWANSHNFFVTRQASQDQNKLQAAKVFIDWISKKSADWAGSGMIPARNSVRQEASFASLKEQSTAAQQVDYMHFLPAVPGLGDVQARTLEQAVNQATLLKKSPKDALSTAAGQATKLMQENLKKFGA